MQPFSRRPTDESELEPVDVATLRSEISDVEKEIVLKRSKRKIINEINKQTGESARWPDAIVPYEIDPLFRIKLYSNRNSYV